MFSIRQLLVAVALGSDWQESAAAHVLGGAVLPSRGNVGGRKQRGRERVIGQ